MEIKTSQEIYEQVKSTLNDKGWIDEEIIARVAMRAFAKQFIDRAITECDYYESNHIATISIGELKDIKQLIK